MKLTENQHKAVHTIDRHVCVDAGAGSGKTGVLVRRILYLLDEEEVPLDRIVAITFTDKAASEMKARLREQARANAPENDPARMTFWRDIERRTDTARISTIHSFCTRLLKENALSLGMDPDFGALDESESHLLQAQVMEETVHGLLDAACGDSPEPSALAAARLASEEKASKLIDRLGLLLRKRASVHDVCTNPGLTSPESLLAVWDEALLDLWRSRFEDWAAELRVLDGHCSKPDDRRESLRAGVLAALERFLASPSTETLYAAFEDAASRTASGGSKKVWDSLDAFNKVNEVFQEVKKSAPACSRALDERAARASCDLLLVYKHVERALREAKAVQNRLDFDDFILRALEVLRNNAEVRARVAAGIDHLLIDEFQDTDSRQLAIARALASEPNGPKLFIVGDAKQSIYRFRGAEVEVFGRARDDAQECVLLDDNFRTVPDVMEFINDFFKKSSLLKAVEEKYAALTPSRPCAREARVEFLLPDTGEDKVNAEDGRVAEAELIARRIAALCTGPERPRIDDPKDKGRRLIEFGDIALLFRTMSSAHIYEKALRDRNIPYNIVAGRGFYERQEISDLRNLLTAVIDPADAMALLGLLRSPIVGVSDDALMRLSANGPLTQALDTPPGEDLGEDAGRIAFAARLLDDLRANAERPLSDFVRLVFQRTGIEAVLLAQEAHGLQKAMNVRKLADLAESFGSTRLPQLSAFVRYLEDVAAVQLQEGEATLQPEGARSVTLMSIHKSKGLEFPVVFLPDLARQKRHSGGEDAFINAKLGVVPRVVNSEGKAVFPAIGTLLGDNETELDEAERARIFYVAMTRARDWLFLCGCPNVDRAKDSWLEILTSQFGLEELGDGELIDGELIDGGAWKARVVRALSDAPAVVKEEDSRERSLDDAERRIAPIRPSRAARRSFTVTELLPHMGEAPTAVGAGSGTGDAEEALLRGTLTHRLFELWDFSSPAPPDIEELVRVECPYSRLHSRFIADLKAIAERFTDSECFGLISGQNSLRRETPFVLRIGDAAVSGVIDLLLGDGRIVDYKTGAFSQEGHAKYEDQMRLYAAAVNALYGEVAPAAFLCYVDEETAPMRSVDVSSPVIEQAMACAETALRRIRDLEEDTVHEHGI